ncbi:MAG: S9 family peptidase, partial [Algibacter sp.]
MKNLLLCYFLISGIWVTAQENLNYQKPSEEILVLAEATRAPSIRIDSKGENMVFLYRSAYKNIETLSEEEMRLGGLRINPKTNINSRQY